MSTFGPIEIALLAATAVLLVEPEELRRRTRTIVWPIIGAPASTRPLSESRPAIASVVVIAERTLAVSPDAAYAFLSDFESKHQTILPANFSDYRVEEGGIGTGTVIAYHFRAGKRERDYRMGIHADPATRRIVESDRGSSLTTTWDLASVDGGVKTAVRITTTWTGATGIGGFFERTFAPLALRRIYREQLALLAAALE